MKMQESEYKKPPTAAPKNVDMHAGIQDKISKTLLLQVSTKLLSFVLNIFTARLATKEMYGYANVTLQFYYALILFFMKE